MKVRPPSARRLAVLPVVALLGLGLSGCQSKAGAAAVVDGHKISESSVGRSVPTTAKQPDQARRFVLNYLIQQRLFTVALNGHGGAPTDAELRANHDTAVSSLLQQQLAGTAGDSALKTAVGTIGVSPSFAPVVLDAFERELVLAKRLNVTSVAGIATEVSRQQLRVSVSPRFGGWDPKALGVVNFSKSQAPSVVSFSGKFPSEQQAAQ